MTAGATDSSEGWPGAGQSASKLKWLLARFVSSEAVVDLRALVFVWLLAGGLPWFLSPGTLPKGAHYLVASFLRASK